MRIEIDEGSQRVYIDDTVAKLIGSGRGVRGRWYDVGDEIIDEAPAVVEAEPEPEPAVEVEADDGPDQEA